MTRPDRKARRGAAGRSGAASGAPRNGAARASGAATAWAVAMYRTLDGVVPARDFLVGCPTSVRLQLLAIVVAVKDAPPPAFPASKMWHAMDEGMKGFHEARDEHDGHLYRLFCVLDRQAPDHGLDAPVLVLISGGTKKVRTKMDSAVYDEALARRADYRATRRILLPAGVPSALRQKS